MGIKGQFIRVCLGIIAVATAGQATGQQRAAAKHIVFSVDQIRFAPTADNTLLAGLADLHSNDEIATYLKSKGVQFARAITAADSTQMSPQALKQMLSVPPGEPYLEPTSQGFTASVILSRTETPSDKVATQGHLISNPDSASTGLSERPVNLPQNLATSPVPASGKPYTPAAVGCVALESFKPGSSTLVWRNSCAFPVSVYYCTQGPSNSAFKCGRNNKIIQGSDNISANGSNGPVLLTNGDTMLFAVCKDHGYAVDVAIDGNRLRYRCH